MRGDGVVLVAVLVAPLDVGVGVDAPGTPIHTASSRKTLVRDLRSNGSRMACLPTSKCLQDVPMAGFQV